MVDCGIETLLSLRCSVELLTRQHSVVLAAQQFAAQLSVQRLYLCRLCLFCHHQVYLLA